MNSLNLFNFVFLDFYKIFGSLMSSMLLLLIKRNKIKYSFQYYIQKSTNNNKIYKQIGHHISHFEQIQISMLEYSLMDNKGCTPLFCGCETIKDDGNSQVDVGIKVCIFIALILSTVIVSVKLSLQWFIYKDYYPLKQKSPYLCILMIICILIQLVLYPIVYTSNYFTYMFNQQSVRYIFRSVQTAFSFSVQLIYLVRCLRIFFAHQTYRRKSFAAQIFQRQYLLALIIVGIITFKGVYTILLLSVINKDNFDFALPYEMNPTDQNSPYYKYFYGRLLVTNFIWQILLTYCYWLQKNINFRYSMKQQLMILLGMTQLTNIFYIVTLGIAVNNPLRLQTLCVSFYPMGEFCRVMSWVIALIISIYIPLKSKKIYHVHLPYEPQSGLIKTMRNFLMQPQFLQIFSKYLQHLDNENQNHQYIKILKFWQEMVKIKINRHYNNYQSFCQNVKSLLTDSQQDRDSLDLINNIKSTLGNRESQQHPQNINFLPNVPNVSTDSKSIIQKADAFQQMVLKKLNKIYTQKYYFTQSYSNLRQIIKDYDRIRLNMVVFNFSLVVDRGSTFN